MIIDGKVVSSLIKENVKKEVETIKAKYNKTPSLAVVLVGENPASLVYVSNKEKACEKAGIKSIMVKMDESSSEEEVVLKVRELAQDENVNAILVQLPLPGHINKDNVLKEIPFNKDADGLTHENVARLSLNEESIVPCTPMGVVDLLKYYNIPIDGANVAILGRSILVGKPLQMLLTNLNSTVTLCHSKTKNLNEITKKADIVVAAIGSPKFLKADMVKEGAVVVDVGINRLESGIVGDADFDELINKCSYITPVPGGCGLMTVAELLNNTIKCFYSQNK